MKFKILILVISLLIASSSFASSKLINLVGKGACQNSVTSLVREEVSNLKGDDTVTIFIESSTKGFVPYAIKLEELPVIYEEITEGEVTHFIIRLKGK